MEFDTSRWNEPATRSELADVCMAVSTALHQLTLAYHMLQLDKKADIEEHIDALSAAADELSDMFDELSGFIDSEPKNG